MKSFIVKLLWSRPRGHLMEYLVEWNDGTIEWICEKEYLIKINVRRG